MQKQLYTALLAITILLGFSSCVREYTCQCKISFSGSPGLPNPIVNEYTIKDNKDNAASLCEQASSTFTDSESGITTEEVCKLF